MLFKRLTDLSYKRSAMEAIGFYIAYFLLLLLIAGIIGGLSALSSGDEEEVMQLASRLGIATVTLATLILAFAIVLKKDLLHHFPSIALAVLAGICAMFGGALLGLLPVAYLTMKKPQPKL